MKNLNIFTLVYQAVTEISLIYNKNSGIIIMYTTNLFERSVNMAFDYKKKYKEIYTATFKPEIITVPKAHFIGYRGEGDATTEKSIFHQSIGALYTLAYALKGCRQAGHDVEGFYDFVVPPLETLWYMDDFDTLDYGKKTNITWTTVIRLPEFFSEDDLQWAIKDVYDKKHQNCSKAEYLTYDEGMCLQIQHLGPYPTIRNSIALLDDFIHTSNYVSDFSKERFHHEIYLSNPWKVEPEKNKSIIRIPIKLA